MTETTQQLTVGQVAERFGVTVRTLHHYDEIGVLTPSQRTWSGYRLYTEADLERLATIVLYRRLEIGLEEIAALLDGGPDVAEHLRRQRATVITRIDELRALVTALDHALEAAMGNRPATTEELKAMFGDGFDEAYAAEAQERWGDTPAWSQSQARTAAYGTADWAAVKAEMDAVNSAFVAALTAGEPAVGVAAMDAAEAHRRHFDERFYDVSYAMHRGLADMYVADPRFTATYEELAPGLAAYVRDAIYANADRHA
ncbi:MerR family transcriptional regulator [Nostocoides vanveenii]|uniref:MerR family transcriptional regulator n=1 Tax=Nostocoides vanveenii TaxID=330835 RepID=A0ABN2KWG8_9MICO